MILYPTSDLELEQAFRTERDCLEYIISVRWPEGPRCPQCRHDKLWRNEDGLTLECAACGHKIRPLVGTIFQDTRLSLRCWFKIMWYIMSQKYGANAIGLSRTLKLANSTTWNILHKLRRTMVRAEREKLGPVVEVDESYIGGREPGKPGRGAEKKALIAVAVELSSDEKQIGRVRLAVIPDAKSNTLVDFINKNVEPGATIITDGLKSYLAVKAEGFKHVVKTVKPGQEVLPHAHLMASLLKRWLLGTYQGGSYRRYLEYYLDEYVFRFNRRKSKSRGKLFRRLMEQAVVTPPITRKEMREQAQQGDISTPDV
jgi:transposase-like protein/Zn ribbon nucleic-acid-binding protein